MITIQELLFSRGLDKNAKIKLVKHKNPNRISLYNLYCNNNQDFLYYQSGQTKDVFNVDYIVSFVGKEDMLRFVGVYKVLDKAVYDEPKHYEINDVLFAETIHYELEEVKGFEDLKERVIIDWGKSRNWHHGIDIKKEVVEIHPGLHYTQFKDYSDVILNYNELKEIIGNAHKDWKIPLTVTNAIYLILDKKEGKQYVGSTYSKENGIWGRWSGYAKSGHNGNKLLKKLFEEDENYADNFQWSILTLISKNITEKEAITLETLYKKKLGSRAFGLNGN